MLPFFDDVSFLSVRRNCNCICLFKLVVIYETNNVKMLKSKFILMICLKNYKHSSKIENTHSNQKNVLRICIYIWRGWLIYIDFEVFLYFLTHSIKNASPFDQCTTNGLQKYLIKLFLLSECYTVDRVAAAYVCV